MDTREIYRALTADPFVTRHHFVRVLPRDLLPTRIDRTKRAAFILNLDTSERPGSHWISLYYDGAGKVEYFDSFGLPPRHEEIINFINRHSIRPYDYNPRVLQDVLSNTCGLYCIYFLLIKSRGGTMRRVLLPFSNRQYHNDRLVVRLTRPWLVKAGLHRLTYY